jgi:hypothetical protein
MLARGIGVFDHRALGAETLCLCIQRRRPDPGALWQVPVNCQSRRSQTSWLCAYPLWLRVSCGKQEQCWRPLDLPVGRSPKPCGLGGCDGPSSLPFCDCFSLQLPHGSRRLFSKVGLEKGQFLLFQRVVDFSWENSSRSIDRAVKKWAWIRFGI